MKLFSLLAGLMLGACVCKTVLSVLKPTSTNPTMDDGRSDVQDSEVQGTQADRR